MTHLGLQRIMIPGSQVSALTTGNISLAGAKGAYAPWAGPEGGFDALASHTITSSGSVGTVSFAGIPTGYKHLQVTVSGTEPTGDAYFSIVFNSDTTQTQYPRHRVYGSGTSTGAGFQNTDGTTKGVIIGIPAYSTSYPSVSIANILNYNSDSEYKTVRISHGQVPNGTGIIELNSSVWLSTDPIQTIDVRCNLSGGGSSGNTFNANSKISLYGVK